MAFIKSITLLVLTAVLLQSNLGTASYIRRAQEDEDKKIEGNYIIEVETYFNPRGQATGLLNGLKNKYGQGTEIVHYYDNVINGFAVKNFPEDKIDGLRRNPHVKDVYQDVEIETYTVQENIPWSLDRIDDVTFDMDNSYMYNYTGAGVDVYVLDVAVVDIPAEFEGRFASCVSVTDATCSSFPEDPHGTHVAGTIGSKTFGVAKGVTLHSVSVFKSDGGAGFKDFIAGLDYIVGIKKQNPSKKMVVNMSLGGRRLGLINKALERAHAAGIFMVAAAGNEQKDACLFYPAGSEYVVTVAASNTLDAEASWTNKGKCVDIYAPGARVISLGNDGMPLELRGTSMASPHVAGVAAMYMEAGRNPYDLLSDATEGILQMTGPRNESPNKLLYTGALLSFP